MDKGYSRETVENNIANLMTEGDQLIVAIARAVSKARDFYKKDYPDSVNFPKHLAPGNVMNTYMKGGDEVGEEE